MSFRPKTGPRKSKATYDSAITITGFLTRNIINMPTLNCDEYIKIARMIKIIISNMLEPLVAIPSTVKNAVGINTDTSKLRLAESIIIIIYGNDKMEIKIINEITLLTTTIFLLCPLEIAFSIILYSKSLHRNIPIITQPNSVKI